MSQPPQPPNQPPQGGFGAPQDPPPSPPPGGADRDQSPSGGQSGYGYPRGTGQPDDTQPAVPASSPVPPPPPGPPPGAPTQGASVPPPPPPPQTPPPGAPGYGYPAQQQTGPGGPYPPPQPGYGYPPAQPPAGAGSGKKQQQRMIAAVSAAVVLALLVVGGFWFFTKDDDGGGSQAKDSGGSSQGSGQGGSEGGDDGGKKNDDPPADQPKTIRSKALTDIPKRKVSEQMTVTGMWVTDDVVAKGDVNQITAYPVAGGSTPKWKIPLPGELCWATTHVTEDGKTAVAYHGKKPSSSDEHPRCDQIGLIDLKAGELVWHKSLKDGDENVQWSEVTIGGDVVAAGSSHGGAAWDLKGKSLWQPQDDDECRDTGYGGGKKLVAVRQCGDYDNPRMEIQTLNPKTGGTKSTYKLSRGIDYPHVASTDPLVIGVDAGDSTGSGVSDFLAIDDSEKVGKLRSKTPTSNGKYVPDCPSTDVEGCSKFAISDNKLFLPTDDHGGFDDGPKNEVVAFSLDTGKPVGKTEGVDKVSLVPMHADEDGNVIVHQKASYHTGGAIWRIDPKTYKKARLMNNPTTEDDIENSFGDNDWYVYRNDRFYLGTEYATEKRDYDDGERLLMVFGAS